MLVYLVCVVVITAAQAPADLDPPYCAARYRRLCRGKGRHVACAFPTPGPGESCVNYTRVKFTKELRHFVTHYINRRRQRLATGAERVRGGAHLPRPEVMMQVEWDRELALLAQRLADQCTFVHDDCRATVRFPYAGQTVGEVKWRHTSESDMQNVAKSIRRVLDAWWGERRRVTVTQLIQPFRLNTKGTIWGHFSQLAVWTLRAVGCGAVRHGSRHPRLLLVCDFSHTNMLGQRTIVPGVLSPCPIHTARNSRSQYPTLCTSVRYQEIHQTDEINDHDIYHTYDEDFLLENDTMPHEDDEEEGDDEPIPTRKQIRLNDHGSGITTDKYSDVTENTGVYKDARDSSDIADLSTRKEGNDIKIKKIRNRTKPADKMNKEDGNFRVYPVREGERMRDRGRNRDKEIVRRPSENFDQFVKNLQHETREKWHETVQNPSKNEASYKQYHKLEQESNKSPDKETLFVSKDHQDRSEPFEFEVFHEKDYDKDRSLDKDKDRLSEKEDYQDLEEIEGKGHEKISGMTTEKSKTRYVVKLSDIQSKQNQLDEFKQVHERENSRYNHLIKDNDMVNMKLEKETYNDDPIGTSQYKKLQPIYKDRLNQINYKETTVKNMFESTSLFDFRRMKTASAPGPRDSQFYEAVGARHRWRPSKERPERPGARVLITKSYIHTSARPGAPKKIFAAVASLSMDKEDVEQLFKDTGFNLEWKQHKKIL